MNRLGKLGLLAGLLSIGACALNRPAPLSDAAAASLLNEISRVARPRFETTRHGAWAWAGHADYLGEPCRFTFEWDGERAFRREVEGRLGRTIGFDGARGWSRSSTGLVRALALEDLDRERLVTAALVGSWADAAAPVRVRATGADEATITLRLSLDDSPMIMDLVVDRSSGEPAQLSRLSESGTNTWTFAGWQSRQGALVPTRILHAAADGGIQNTIEFEDVTALSLEADDQRFERPVSAPDNVEFHAGVDARIETRAVSTGHVLVRPILEGLEVGWFVFDSGAGGLVIDERVANALKLEQFGNVVAVGVSGRTTAHFRQGSSFRLGPLELHDPIFVDLSLAFLERSFGVPIAGIVGYDVLAHAIVSLDPKVGEIAIYPPDTPDLEDLPWTTLVLDERLPCIEASFEGGHSGLFKLDTGASGTLTFHSPAVKRLKLLSGRKVHRSRTAGVGGVGQAWRGPLAWFEFGGARFQGLEVEYADSDLGAFADVYTLGNLGQGLLSQFRLVFDYPAERIALIPHGAPKRAPVSAAAGSE